ncbi:MAG: phosphotransferase [Steroidobacteraceae bacterium]
MKPEQVAAEVLAVAPESLTATRVKGGLTNESWCVQSAHDAVVVRISTVDEHALQLNRYSEVEVLSLVQQHGIGAEVLLCAPERRLLVTRKLPAETLDPETMRNAATIYKLARLLRRLHALPAPASVQQVDLPAVLLGYWQSLDEQAQPLGWPLGNDAEARRHAMSIALESAQSVMRCLCHNDVHHLNLMSDGERLWLLDWEYAGIGDPLFDLAAVCCYHGYDTALREQLLLAYFERLDAADSERLLRMCWLFDYIRDLWFAVRRLETESILV